MREVCRQTGADIKSWTDQSKDEASRATRPTRTFVIEVRLCHADDSAPCFPAPWQYSTLVSWLAEGHSVSVFAASPCSDYVFFYGHAQNLLRPCKL